VLLRQTELLEEERKEWQHKHTKAETEAKDLRFTGTSVVINSESKKEF